MKIRQSLSLRTFQVGAALGLPVLRIAARRVAKTFVVGFTGQMQKNIHEVLPWSEGSLRFHRKISLFFKVQLKRGSIIPKIRYLLAMQSISPDLCLQPYILCALWECWMLRVIHSTPTDR
jgi:hypothetical protein